MQGLEYCTKDSAKGSRFKAWRLRASRLVGPMRLQAQATGADACEVCGCSQAFQRSTYFKLKILAQKLHASSANSFKKARQLVFYHGHCHNRSRGNPSLCCDVNQTGKLSAALVTSTGLATITSVALGLLLTRRSAVWGMHIKRAFATATASWHKILT